MPGRCLGDTRSLPGASRGSVRAAFSDAIENTRKFECFWEPPRTSREAPGDPEGHQKSIKNRLFGEKKTFQTWLIALFCLHKAMFHVFCSISLRLFTKINEKTEGKRDVQFHRSACFLNMTTFTKHRILRYESYFLLFLVFTFFLKKRQKITPKFKDQLASQKSPKNGVRGTISGKNCLEFTRKRPKILENCRNC